MALSLAQKFINLGMSAPLSVELASQLASGLYNWKRLAWLSMIPALAKYIAESLSAGTFDADQACELSLTPAQANLIKSDGFANETSALIARFVTPPSEARKAQINALVVGLKQAGVFGKLEILYLLAAADSQAASLNWVGNQYNAVETGGPSFQSDRGYTGNGSSAFLDTTVSPTALTLVNLNSISAGIWMLTAGQSSNGDFGQTGSNNLQIITRTTANDYNIRINSASGETINGVTDGSGLSSYSRSSSSSGVIYKNGINIRASVTASTTLNNSNIVILRNAASFSPKQVAAAFVGASLSDVEQASLYTSVRRYLVSVGAVS